MKQILAIGLNPVLQKSLVFEQFREGEVNRAAERYLTAGGKGIHFAMAVNRIVPGSATVAHFLGGGQGELVARLLAEAAVAQIAVPIGGETRMCNTILCRATGRMTELIEPSPRVTPGEATEMRRDVFAALGDMAGIGLCGTWPEGIDGEFYAEVARRKGDATLLLDGYRGVESTLQTGLVDVLKINLDELRELTGLEDVRGAAERVRLDYAVKLVALTDGPGRAFLVTAKGAWSLELPRLESVVNPIGAGDTVGGVTLARLLQGAAPVVAFADGLAAASASCLHIQGARFDLAEMKRLRAGIKINQI